MEPKKKLLQRENEKFLFLGCFLDGILLWFSKEKQGLWSMVHMSCWSCIHESKVWIGAEGCVGMAIVST